MAPDFATAIGVLPARHRQSPNPQQHLAKKAPVQLPFGQQQPRVDLGNVSFILRLAVDFTRRTALSESSGRHARAPVELRRQAETDLVHVFSGPRLPGLEPDSRTRYAVELVPSGHMIACGREQLRGSAPRGRSRQTLPARKIHGTSPYVPTH